VAPSASYLDFIKDLLSPFGLITIKRMFGAAGVYCDGLFFAVVGDDDLWLKVDSVTKPEFEAAGLGPFIFEGKDGTKGVMSYYNAPEEIFDDHDALAHWVGLAIGAAQRAKKPAKKKKAKKKTAKKKSKSI